MALVMPVYLMLVFGFTSVALLLFVYGEVTYASRAAVRYASTHSFTNANEQNPACQAVDIADPSTGLVSKLVAGVSGGQLSVPVPGCNGKNAVGSLVTITVQVNYPIGLPYIAASGITMSSTASGYILH